MDVASSCRDRRNRGRSQREAVGRRDARRRVPPQHRRSRGNRFVHRFTGPRESRALIRIEREDQMDLGLKGKLAVVSGSTAGIGFAIAAALAAEGAHVVVNGRTDERVNAAVEKIRKQTGVGAVRGVAADLGTAMGSDLFLKKVAEADILINNLGIFEPKPFAQISDADWLRFFEENVLSA